MFSMRRSSRKMLIVGALALAALTGPVAAAQAAPPSLTITPAADQFSGQANTIKVSGVAVDDGFVAVYAEALVTTCEANAQDEIDNHDWVPVGTGSDAVATGAYSLDLQWSPILTMKHVVCAYLYANGQALSDPPQAVATSSVTVVDKPVNNDTDNDGVPNDVDACPAVAGSGVDGCPPPVKDPVTTPTPITTVVPGGLPIPVPNVPAAPADPTGVLKLKSSKGRATSCGTGCLIRTRAVGPFAFSLKVQVAGAKTKETASVALRSKSAQAGKAGKVCVSSYAAKLKLTCKTTTWTVGQPVTLKSSITTPAKIGPGSRPGFAVTAYVGKIQIGYGTSLYLKSAGGKIRPDTNESACAASAGAHAAC